MNRARYSGTRLGGTIVSRRRASDSLVVLLAAVGLLACSTTGKPTLQDEFESTLELAEEGR